MASSLFSEGVERVVPRKLPRAISAYERLDTESSERASHARSTLDSWWRDLPTQARQEIRSRFQQKRTAGHLGAFWEIFLYHAISRAGLDPTMSVGQESEARVPDFRAVMNDQAPIHVEATAALGDDAIDPKLRMRVDQMYDTLEQVKDKSFFLEVSVRGVGSTTLGKPFVRAINRWLEPVDPDAILAGKAPAPETVITDDGWVIGLRGTPRSLDIRGETDVRMISARLEGFSTEIEHPAEMDTFSEIDDISPILRSLKRKAIHGYETADEPLILAVLCAGGFVEDRDVVQALLGRFTYAVGAGGVGVPSGGGLWLGDKGQIQNTTISAVLVGMGMDPRVPNAGELTLWTNPWAARPVPHGELPWRWLEILNENETAEHGSYRRKTS